MISSKSTGVYVIRNLVNGKIYIGSASNSFAKRFRNHRYDLERGKHHCQPLQRAWIKYGPDSFEFSPLVETAPDDAVSIEQQYLDELRPEYNVCQIAGSARGVTHTPEARARMRAGMLASNARPEVKRRRSEAQKLVWSDPKSIARKVAGQNQRELNERKRKTMRQAWADPEAARRRVDGMRAAQQRPDERKRKAEDAAKRWSDVGYRERMAAVTAERWKDPEYRAQMSAMSKAAHAQPETKARRSASLKAALRKQSPITAEVLEQIRRALADGEAGSVIAARHCVSETTISSIKNGKHWSYTDESRDATARDRRGAQDLEGIAG